MNFYPYEKIEIAQLYPEVNLLIILYDLIRLSICLRVAHHINLGLVGGDFSKLKYHFLILKNLWMASIESNI